MSKISIELRNNSIVAINEFMKIALKWTYADKIGWLSKNYNLSDKSIENILRSTDEKS